MRRLLTWIVVSLGVAAVARRLRRRGREDAAATVEDEDPADELRQKLAETRSEQAPAAEATPEAPAGTESGVEERRADVHEQGRSTVDEMRGADEDP